MTPEDKAEFDDLDLKHLIAQPEFLRFAFRILEASGLLRSAGDVGRKSLGEDVMRWIEEALPEQHPSGLPIGASIQLLSAVRNESVAKEKPRRVRGSSRFDDGSADG